MGQGEVIEFLRECELPKTRRQIAEALDCEPNVVSKKLKVLLKWGEVNFIEHSRHKASKMVGYILLRRTRFFYIKE